MTTHVHLLGATKVVHNGALYEPPLDKRMCLLAYLACAGTYVSRERLAFLFWPDVEPDRARTNLRGLLARVRALPFADGVEAHADRIRWPVSADLREFRDALAGGSWGEALATYRGELLRDLATEPGFEFEAWLEHEREQVREGRRQAARRLAQSTASREDAAAATAALASLVRDDQADEEILRTYMDLQLRLGGHEEALRAYRTFVTRLRDEYGLEPSAETHAAAQHLIHARQPGVRAQEPQALLPERAGAERAHAVAAGATGFVGRDVEIAEVRHLLLERGARLVTLHGYGGVGKTRLAQQVLWELGPHYPDGVYEVILRPWSGSTFLAERIARGLSVPSRPGVPPLRCVADHVGERRVLVLLDNAEHVLDEAALLEELLAACPNLRVLASSRIRLDLGSEWALAVQGLPVPPESVRDPHETTHFESVRLFIGRAIRSQPRFDPSGQDLVAISGICRLLDGVPLALELAAAWIRLLSCRELLDEIARSLDTLATSRRDLPERHASLRAIFEQSWELLTPSEQAALARFAVFHDGFTREAASVVAGARLPVIGSLQDKSLVSVVHEGRYDLHPLVRSFALEALVRHEERHGEAVRAHARFYLQFLQRLDAHLHSPREAEMLRSASAEYGNVIAAWRDVVRRGPLRAAETLVQPMLFLHGLQGRFREAEVVLRESLEACEPQLASHPVLHGRLRQGYGWVLSNLGRYDEAQAHCELGVEVSRAAGDHQSAGMAMHVLGTSAARQGRLSLARERLETALDLAKLSGSIWLQGMVLNSLASLHIREGRLVEAAGTLEKAMDLNSSLGHAAGVVNNLDELGRLSLRLGRAHHALDYLQRGVDLAHRNRFRQRLPYLLVRLAAACKELGRYEDGIVHAERALEVASEAGQQVLQAEAHLELGRLLSDAHEPSLAIPQFVAGIRILAEVNEEPLLRAAASDLLEALLAHGQHLEAATIALVLMRTASGAEADDARSRFEAAAAHLDPRRVVRMRAQANHLRWSDVLSLVAISAPSSESAYSRPLAVEEAGREAT